MTTNLRYFLITTLLVITSQTVMAGPRTKAQVNLAAAMALSQASPAAASRQELKTILQKDQLSLVGYDDGPYAIVATDDLFPAVLGVSRTPYSQGRNPNFEFWLKSMSAALAYRAQHNMPAHMIKPDSTLYPKAVGPLCESIWDQLTPYNNLLPSGIYTGCVATAMAQVLYYHKAPEVGVGTRTIYAQGTPVTATFGEDYYDWDNMIDSYLGGYSDAQAEAVALLMRDCGVAANMQYGGYWEGGSGAYSQDAADGLRTYMNMPDAVCVERDFYSDEDWMDMVFNELANVGPLYYGGDDLSQYSGHAFVIHGYRADGMVYLNWGWSGEDDGWYDISLLNPSGYEFSAHQDMIIGIQGNGPKASIVDAVHVDQPGQLAQALQAIVPADSLMLIAGLTVTGQINGADLAVLRQMAGCDQDMNMSKGSLRSLDLSGASFVGGGGSFLNVGSRQVYTAAGRVPELAFYGCRSLHSLALPTDITSIGRGAFAMCNSLDEVRIPTGDDKDYLYDEITGTIYLKADTTTIYIVLPTASGEYAVEKGKTAIDDYAFSGCARISRIQLPSTVTMIGNYAFQSCTALQEIRFAQRDVPETGLFAIDGVRVGSTSIYVPAGSKDKYKNHTVWGRFGSTGGDYINEYGTAIVARNAGRDYGDENPTFGYQVSGDRPAGTPELTCDATIDSPAGDYVIHVSPGTITDEIVDYIDGRLVIWKARLKVSVGEYTRFVGEENPDFELVYDGFKLGEGPDALTVQPVASTTATMDSPEGDYPITISGGESSNYEFRYTAGTLHVVYDPSAIRDAAASGGTYDVYTTHGTQVRKGATSLDDLPKGVYVVNGHKYVVK